MYCNYCWIIIIVRITFSNNALCLKRLLEEAILSSTVLQKIIEIGNRNTVLIDKAINALDWLIIDFSNNNRRCFATWNIFCDVGPLASAMPGLRSNFCSWNCVDQMQHFKWWNKWNIELNGGQCFVGFQGSH